MTKSKKKLTHQQKYMRDISRVKKTRKFNGLNYRLDITLATKKNAKTTAKTIRKGGDRARIRKEKLADKKVYRIYRRRGKKG